MPERPGTIDLGRQLARHLTPVALAIALIIGFGFPALYTIVASNDLRRGATASAEELSNHLRELVAENPALWKYQTLRYLQVLRDFQSWGHLVSIRVLGEDNQSIGEYTYLADESQAWWNVLPPEGRAAIKYNGRTYGTVVVALSRGHLGAVTLALVALCLVLGTALALFAYRVPVRVVTRMESDIRTLVTRLETASADSHRLHLAADQAAREARSLYDVAHSLATSLEVAEILRLIAVETTELLGTPHAQVVLLDEATQSLRLGAAYGTQIERVKNQVFRLGVGVNGVVAQRRASLIVNDYQTWPHRVPDLTDLVAAIGVPLVFRDRLLGVLTTIATTPGWAFTDQQLALLTSFADQAASALENARLYEALRAAAAELEARVVARTRELEETNRNLEVASQHKSEFLANMSHELRTPLNSVLGFAQLLLEQTGQLLSAKQTRFLAHIYTSGQHLLQLINDILDLSKVEAGKMVLHPEPVMIPKLLEEILVIARGLAAKKGLRVETSVQTELPQVAADPVRLKQILFNLLSNAVKFTPEGGRVSVTVARVGGGRREREIPLPPAPSAADTRDDPVTEWLEIRVTDTGIGLTTEEMPRLFQDFVQLEATATKHHEGTGLGLALTKQLVELHDGRIWAESLGRDRGSSFVVHLPFLDVATPRILVVEDEASVRETLELMLQRAGFRVEAAGDAPAAVRAIQAEHPALVILDVGLPPDGAGGWTVLAHLRGSEPLQNVPVLILTGQDRFHAEEALARGANEFLGKPVSAHVLAETVTRLLKRRAPRGTAPASTQEAGS
jgi:signal transduction histidine kinase/ActR/RegA family two-component response regulator